MHNTHKPAKAKPPFLARLARVRPDPELLAEVLPLARAGQVDAQYAAGLIYAEGRGVAPNPLEAYRWLSRAILQGDADAGVLRQMVMLHMTLEEIQVADQRLAKEGRQ